MNKVSHADHLISTHVNKLSVLKIYLASSHDLSRLSAFLRERKLPNLTALSVDGSTYKNRTKLYRFLDELHLDQTRKQEKLSLKGFIISSQELILLCQKLHYLQLRQLNLSHSCSIIGCLLKLFNHSFQTLNTLKLKSCLLNSEDTQSLARANVEGKLPQLEHLDISGY